MDMTNRIAVLGWGSLIWEPKNDYKKLIGDWQDDGPILPIEFSRISSSRNGALTLVIDLDNGAQVRTKYTLSTRENPEDAACDLRIREGTIIRHIGLIDLENNFIRSHWTSVTDKIKNWATERNLRAVVWTDLPSNFAKKTGNIFTPEKAIEYLKSLPKEGQKFAKEYILNAPIEVQTSFRSMVQSDEWFNEIS